VTWARYDDGFHSNKKIAAVRGDRKNGLAALGLHVLMNTWSHQEGTGGHVPSYLPALMGDTTGRLAQLLEDRGLLDALPDGDGWLFHDWETYGPPPDLADKRSEAGSKGAANRWGKHGNPASNGMANAIANGSQPDSQRAGASAPAGARPVPSTSLREAQAARIDVEQVCSLLAKLMIENGCRPPSVTAQWRDSARLLLDKDGRPLAEVERVLRWCQADEFWRVNILSLPKFRQQYDRLRLKMEQEHPAQAGPTRDAWRHQ
jgi:hypothetical protein